MDAYSKLMARIAIYLREHSRKAGASAAGGYASKTQLRGVTR